MCTYTNRKTPNVLCEKNFTKQIYWKKKKIETLLYPLLGNDFLVKVVLRSPVNLLRNGTPKQKLELVHLIIYIRDKYESILLRLNSDGCSYIHYQCYLVSENRHLIFTR